MPRLSITEIAERNRVLPTDTAAPGRWRLSVTPWVGEIQERLHPDDPAQVIVYEGAAQASKKTTIGLNWILAVAGGWYPSRMLIAQDTLDNARDFSKDDLDSMIQLCPALRDRVRDASSRTRNETILGKFFPGGRIRLVGMHSANAVRRMAAKFCWLDELDGAKNNVGYEGNIVQLVLGRQTTFGPARKLYLSSTPTEEDNSEIHEWFLRGDQRRFWLPCPLCGEFQPLEWEAEHQREVRRFVWDPGDPSSARYRCCACGREWQEDRKLAVLAQGVWRPDAPQNYTPTNLVRSYNLNALYAEPGALPWPTLVAAWEAAVAKYKATGDAGDIRTYVNIRKAKVFAAPGQLVERRHVLDHRVCPDWRESVPEGVRLVVAGADVHKEHTDVVTLGVGAGWECWALDAARFLRVPGDDTLWTDLDLLLRRQYTTTDGRTMWPAVTCIDSGYDQQKVLEYAMPRLRWHVYAVKGVQDRATGGAIFDTRAHGAGKSGEKGRFFQVHVTEAKNDLYDYLMNPRPAGPRCLHIPQSIVDNYADFLDQLCSEKRVRNDSGRWVWEQIRQRDNHWWDCLVYALAAAHCAALTAPGLLRTDPPPPLPAAAPPLELHHGPGNPRVGSTGSPEDEPGWFNGDDFSF